MDGICQGFNVDYSWGHSFMMSTRKSRFLTPLLPVCIRPYESDPLTPICGSPHAINMKCTIRTHTLETASTMAFWF